MYDVVAWSGGAVEIGGGAGFGFDEGFGLLSDASPEPEFAPDLTSFYRCETDAPLDVAASPDASAMPNQSLLELPPPDLMPPMELLQSDATPARASAAPQWKPPSPGPQSPDLFHRIVGFTVVEDYGSESASTPAASGRAPRDEAAEAQSEATREANRFASGAALNAGLAGSAWTGGEQWAEAVQAGRSQTIDPQLAASTTGRDSAREAGPIHVQPGDSFDRIARRWAPEGASEAQVYALRDRLVAANPQVDDVNRLVVGQALNLPAADTIVDRGAMARIALADAGYQITRAAALAPPAAGMTVIDGTGAPSARASFESLAQPLPSMFEPVAPFLLGPGGHVVADLAHAGPQAQPVPMAVPPLTPSDLGVRVLGAVELAGGASQVFLGGSLMAAGVPLAKAGLGIPMILAGGVLTLGGADHVVAGAKTFWTGEAHPTWLVSSMEEVGAPPLVAATGDLLINGGGSIAAARWLRAVPIVPVAAPLRPGDAAFIGPMKPTNWDALTVHPDAHAFAVHGGNVTDADLIVRARTGVKPDGSTGPIPPLSSAFYSDDLLILADRTVRDGGGLASAIARQPGQSVVRVETQDVGHLGVDLGFGYRRLGPTGNQVFNATAPGPLQRIDGFGSVQGIYELNPTNGVWETITLYPAPH